MGSIKRSKLSDAEICRRYIAGEGAGVLSLRAGLPYYRIPEILTAGGVRIRGPHEALRLAHAQRKARQAA